MPKGTSYKCPVCGERFFNYTRMRDHLKKCKEKLKREERFDDKIVIEELRDAKA